MLHVCAESRQVALGWYKLGLHSKLTKPRVYFDFDSDYLYVGCNECGPVSFCRDCTNKVVFEDCLAVKRVLVHWAPRGNSPFFSLHLCLRGVKEVLLFNPCADPLNPDTELAHLQETTKPFDWQEGKSLYDVFLEEKPKLDQYCMDSVTILQAQAKDLGPLHPTKIARVELVASSHPRRQKYLASWEQIRERRQNQLASKIGVKKTLIGTRQDRTCNANSASFD